MHQCHELEFLTTPYALKDITDKVESLVARSRLSTGLCTVFLCHTSASLVIQENADPDVLHDLSEFFKRLVPETGHYRHRCEGPDDMPAHIRTALTQTSMGIPIHRGKLVLGTWQALYLWEHRSSPHRRTVIVHLSGDIAADG